MSTVFATTAPKQPVPRLKRGGRYIEIQVIDMCIKGRASQLSLTISRSSYLSGTLTLLRFPRLSPSRLYRALLSYLASTRQSVCAATDIAREDKETITRWRRRPRCGASCHKDARRLRARRHWQDAAGPRLPSTSPKRV
jgi:hypothetical protein